MEMAVRMQPTNVQCRFGLTCLNRFIIEGAATTGWALIAGFILPDFPANTARLTPREREIAILRLERDDVQNRTEDTPRLSSLDAIKQSLTSWRVWLLIAGYMVIVGSSTLSYFYPTLVEGLGYTSNKAQYMVVPIYAVAFVCVGFTSYFSDKFPTQRGAIIAVSSLSPLEIFTATRLTFLL